MIQREWIRVSRLEQAIADIHEVLEPLAVEACAEPVTDDDMIVVSDCGACPSCRARAALNMLDLDLAPAVGASGTVE